MISNIKYKLLRRLTISFIIIISATIFILCNTLYFIFQASAASDINAYVANSLKWKSSEVETIIEQVNRISFQLMSRSEVTNYFTGRNMDEHLNKFKMTITVKEIYTMYPFISSIEIFNTENDVYYNTLNFTNEAIETIKNSSVQLAKQSFQDGRGYSHRVMTDISNNPITSEQNVISFIVNDYVYKNNTVIINVHSNYLMDKIGTKPTAGSEVFLINGNNEVISGTKNILSAQADEFIAFQKIYTNVGQGYYSKSQYGKHLINYIKLPAFDWYLVNATQSGFMSGGSFEFFMISNGVALAVIILGGGLTALIGKNVYAPIIRVIEKINSTNGSGGRVDEIQIINNEIFSLNAKAEFANNVIYKNQDVVKKHTLMSLIENRGFSEPQEKLFFNENLKYLCNDGNSFRLILFKLDNYDKLSNNHTIDDLNLFLYGIANIISEVLSDRYPCEAIRLSPDVICAAVTTAKESSPNLVPTQKLREIITSVKSYMGYSISAIAGDSVSLITDISKSYSSCQKYLAAQYFLGYESIIDGDIYQKNNSTKTDCEYNYNKNILSVLFSKNDYEQLVLNVNAFIQELTTLSYNAAKNQIELFIDELKNLLLSKTEFLNMSGDEIVTVCKNIQNTQTVYIFADQLLELSDMVYAASFTQKTANTMQKHYDMVMEIKEYVNKNYSDPTLSLNQISDKINVSPGYVGRIFSSLAQQSLVQYILQVRIENAKIMLTSTALPVFEISEKVGILSPTYFTTLFKNSVGLTPSSYREKSKNKYGL